MTREQENENAGARAFAKLERAGIPKRFSAARAQHILELLGDVLRAGGSAPQEINRWVEQLTAVQLDAVVVQAHRQLRIPGRASLKDLVVMRDRMESMVVGLLRVFVSVHIAPVESSRMRMFARATQRIEQKIRGTDLRAIETMLGDRMAFRRKRDWVDEVRVS